MFVLPLKADITRTSQNVRYLPKADIGRRFDHSLGERKSRWYFSPDRLCCLFVRVHFIRWCGLNLQDFLATFRRPQRPPFGFFRLQFAEDPTRSADIRGRLAIYKPWTTTIAYRSFG
jgi:hypothetical protein